MRGKFLLIIISILYSYCSFSQQEPQYTIYWNNYSVYNPAATGLFYKYYASVTGRDQWVGYKGAPQTVTGVFDMRIKPLHGAVGLNYTFDKIGQFTDNNISLNYSYSIDLKKNRALNIGLSPGIRIMKVDYSGFNAIDDDDPLLQQKGTKTQTKFNLNLGAMYVSEHLLLGVSSTQLIENNSDNVNYELYRHYYVTGFYNFNLSNKIELRPGLLWKSDGTSWQIDANLLAYYKKMYWAGVTWRKTDAIAFMAGWDIKQKFRLGYSYDMTTSALRGTSYGSHEIVLGLMLN